MEDLPAPLTAQPQDPYQDPAAEDSTSPGRHTQVFEFVCQEEAADVLFGSQQLLGVGLFFFQCVAGDALPGPVRAGTA